MNYPRNLFVAVLALAIAGIGCNSDNASNPTAASPNPQAANYQYTAFDPTGATVATGSLTVAVVGTSVAGQRDIKGNAPEVGTGAISGQQLSDGSVQIELNPGSAAEVILQGKYEGDALTGKRLLDTGDPPLNRTIGTFTMSRSSLGTH